MFPLDASKQFIVNVGHDRTKHARLWFIDQIFRITKDSVPTKLIKNQDSIVYEAHLNRFTWNPFYMNYLGTSDLGYFEVFEIDDNIVIKYKILFHEASLLFLYFLFFVILILLIIDIPLFPWKVGIPVFFVIGYAISYFGTLIWLNMIIRVLISDYQFRLMQDGYHNESIL